MSFRCRTLTFSCKSLANAKQEFCILKGMTGDRGQKTTNNNLQCIWDLLLKHVQLPNDLFLSLISKFNYIFHDTEWFV